MISVKWRRRATLHHTAKCLALRKMQHATPLIAKEAAYLLRRGHWAAK